MDRHQHEKMSTNETENLKYEPILKFSYTNPHKIIKPESNKAVTRWSPEEKRSYVEKNYTQGEYIVQPELKSSPRYENLQDLDEDDCTYESIEYIDGVYKMKASEPQQISTHTRQKAETKDAFSYPGRTEQIMFSEMTYEERQEERRRLELGEEKGFPVYDYFARSEALKKNAPSPTETHTKINYSKWLLNEINKEYNLTKVSEVRHKASVSSAFRGTRAQTATPTAPETAAQKSVKSANQMENNNQKHNKNSVTESNRDGGSYEEGEDEEEGVSSASDSRSESPFEFTSRRARFENADIVNSEEIRPNSFRNDQKVTDEAPVYANVSPERKSRRQNWTDNSVLGQDAGLPPRPDRQGASSPFVQDSSSYRCALVDNNNVRNDYRVDERQGYIEKINHDAEANIYDYPQMPPRPVEVRFSFQPENQPKFQTTRKTLPVMTSKENNQIHTQQGSQFNGVGNDISRTDGRRDQSTSGSSEIQSYSVFKAGLMDHSSSKGIKSSSEENQRARINSPKKANTHTHEEVDVSNQIKCTKEERSKSYDLMNMEHSDDSPVYSVGKNLDSQFHGKSPKLHLSDDSETVALTKFSTTKKDAFDATLSVQTDSRKSRRDHFQATRQEKEKSEPTKFNDSTSTQRSRSYELEGRKAKKYEKKVSDMVKLFEELAQQQLAYKQRMLQEHNLKYGYDRTKTGSLHDLRIVAPTPSPFLYPNDFGKITSRSASCTHLYNSEAVEHNQVELRYGRGTLTGSVPSQDKIPENFSSTEKATERATRNLFDITNTANGSPCKGPLKKTTRRIDTGASLTSKENVFKGKGRDTYNLEKKKCVRIAQTVQSKDDPPFFTTKNYSWTQSRADKSKSYKPIVFNPNVSSINYSHDPKVSAFEKYESKRMNLNAINRFNTEHKPVPMTSPLLGEKHKVSIEARNRINEERRNRGITGLASLSGTSDKSENYYVSSTVTMTRRHPQRSVCDISDNSTISSAFKALNTTGVGKNELRTASSNADSVSTQSYLSPSFQSTQYARQSTRSPVPARQMRTQSPMNETMLDQGMSRCSSKKQTREVERHFVSSGQISGSQGHEQSYRKSTTFSGQQVRPRSQSADPEQSRRKSSGYFGLERFRVMSPGPAPHFVRMTEEARRKAEDYHVNSDQKLLNIFFDRLIEQHKYSSTSNLPAKRAIVEQSRFIRDSPGRLKQKESITSGPQIGELVSGAQQKNTKLTQSEESSTLRRSANNAPAHGHFTQPPTSSLQKASSGSSSSGLSKPLTKKMYQSPSTSSKVEIESLKQNRITHSSNFQAGGTKFDEHRPFSPEGPEYHSKLEEHHIVQPTTAEQPTSTKTIGRFHVQTTARSTDSPVYPSSTSEFVSKESSSYSYEVGNKSVISNKKHQQQDERFDSSSRLIASNRDSPSIFDGRGAQIHSGNSRTMSSERNSCYSSAPEYFQVQSSEHSSPDTLRTRDTSKSKHVDGLPLAEHSSFPQTKRISNEYSVKRELHSSAYKSHLSSSHDRERLLSPVPYGRTSRGDMISSPLNLPSGALSPASSLFTEDRNWTPRVMSPNQFNSVVNIQTLERNVASPVAHNDSAKDSNVLRFKVSNYDGMSDIDTRKQMYFRSLDADSASVKERELSPPQRSVGQTERA